MIRPLIFGELLFDDFPDGSRVLGGAPFNVAWNLQALGARPLLISRVGNDALGRSIREQMLHWGMDLSAMQLDSAHPTGTVEVRIDDGEPSYEIVAPCAYDFIRFEHLPRLGETAPLYHGTLATRQDTSAATLHRLIEHYAPRRFVDVNLRPPWWDREQALRLLAGACWAKLNGDEFDALCPDRGRGRETWLRHHLDLDLLIVTHGARGARAWGRDAGPFEVTPQTVARITDSVGAGDAFASVILLGLLHGWETPLLLERAQAFASAVVGLRGATTGDPRFYAPFREQWSLS
ncbi:MAG: PfkB family carbohydrate kinase [Candidatus Sedimenticola endophacoides]